MKEKEIQFHFQEVPLEEARNLVVAGDGLYGDVKAVLLEKLPNLPPDKAFAFGLPNGNEMEERARRGLCLGINKTFEKTNLAWRITYSGRKKLFICVPTEEIKVSKESHSQRKAADREQIWKLRSEGKLPTEIAALLKTTENHVAYVLYQTKKPEGFTPLKLQGEALEARNMKIVNLRRQGKSVPEISESLNLSICQVQQVIYKWAPRYGISTSKEGKK